MRGVEATEAYESDGGARIGVRIDGARAFFLCGGHQGGLVGRVTKASADQPEIEVEIAPNVRVRVVRSMISEVRAKGTVKAA